MQFITKIINQTKSFCLALFVLLAVFSCGGDPYPYLYDKAGFDSGNSPSGVRSNPNSPNMTPPDYYRQGGAGYPGQASQQQPYYGQQQQPSYPQQQQQQYPQQQYGQQQPAPYYPPQNSTPPGSRFYSNPYAMPPSTNQYQYYDGDQYYVPPTYYNNVERQPSSTSNSGGAF